jgi:K+-sensing histidine kinase KdpD
MILKEKDTKNEKRKMVEQKEIGLIEILIIIFVIAKLFKIISWSWWWVFSPIWIALLFILGLILFSILIAIISGIISAIIDK